MMTLPKFDNPNITTEELLAEQDRLHQQADKMLVTTGLATIFSRYGELLPIGGSYAYELMVYPDLDMNVIADEVTTQDFARMVAEIAASDFVRGFSAADRVRFAPSHPGRPKGYWIGLDIPFEDDRWGVDLWLQAREWENGNNDSYREKLAHISQEQAAAILAIKYHLIHNGSYGKQFFSTDIYDAVLDHGVLSFDDFVNKSTAS